MKTENDATISNKSKCFYIDGKVQEINDQDTTITCIDYDRKILTRNEYTKVQDLKENDIILASSVEERLQSTIADEDICVPIYPDKNTLELFKFNIDVNLRIEKNDETYYFSSIEEMVDDEFEAIKKILKTSKDKPFNCVLLDEMEQVGDQQYEDLLYASLSVPYSENDDAALFNFGFKVDKTCIKEGYFDIYFLNGQNDGLDIFDGIHGNVKITIGNDSTLNCFVPKYRKMKNGSMFRRGCLLLDDIGNHIVATRCRVLIYDEKN